MLGFRNALLVICNILLLQPVMASDDPLAPPLKPHQLLSRISGYHLRDPPEVKNTSYVDGRGRTVPREVKYTETFSHACTRLENVVVQNVPNTKESKRPHDSNWAKTWMEGQLQYAEKMYSIAMRATIAQELERHTRHLEPAFDEDGQTESLRNPQLLDQLPAAHRLISQLRFMLPIDEDASTDDKILTYKKAYLSLSRIHCFERAFAMAALEDLCPYNMSEGERAFIQKRWAFLSDDWVREELEAMPLILQTITYLSPFNIRYVDLLCVEREVHLGISRLGSFKRLQVLCEFIKDKAAQKQALGNK